MENNKELKLLVNNLLKDIFYDILDIQQNAVHKISGGGLTINEMHIIEAVGPASSKNMGEVARMLNITTSSLTVAVNRLVQKGKIDRVRSDTDRRQVLIRLTDDGIDDYNHHMQFHTQMVDAIISDLKLEEMPLLVDSLDKLREFFRSRYIGLYPRGNDK